MEYLNTWNCDLKSYYGYHLFFNILIVIDGILAPMV